jgi:hypothetical protein
MLFKHKNGQMDVVLFSPYDLDTPAKLKKKGDSVLGSYFSTATSLN